jgi:predicted nucleic acid-binding protein
MGYVVDTCIFIDILLDDPLFGKPSAICLKAMQPEGLLVSPVGYIELAPAFKGIQQEQDNFFLRLHIAFHQPWIWEDTLLAHIGWARYCQLKKAGEIVKRPVADVLIGAFASRFEGLITRNASDFKKVFPALPIITPEMPTLSGLTK